MHNYQITVHSVTWLVNQHNYLITLLHHFPFFLLIVHDTGCPSLSGALVLRVDLRTIGSSTCVSSFRPLSLLLWLLLLLLLLLLLWVVRCSSSSSVSPELLPISLKCDTFLVTVCPFLFHAVMREWCLCVTVYGTSLKWDTCSWVWCCAVL